MQRGKNRLRWTKVIVKNKMSRFLWFSVYIALYYKPFISKVLRPVCNKGITQFYLLSTHRPYLPYSPAARCHCPLNGTHCAYPWRDGQAELKVMGGKQETCLVAENVLFLLKNVNNKIVHHSIISRRLTTNIPPVMAWSHHKAAASEPVKQPTS